METDFGKSSAGQEILLELAYFHCPAFKSFHWVTSLSTFNKNFVKENKKEKNPNVPNVSGRDEKHGLYS